MQPRVRFNARARQGGSHKKKAKRAKDRDNAPPEEADPNAPIVVPKSEAEKEQERKAKMREEVRRSPIRLSRAMLTRHMLIDAGRVELESKQQEEEEVGQVHCS